MSHSAAKHDDTPLIPSYEEAIFSYSHPTRTAQGSQGVGTEAETQGLLPGTNRWGGRETASSRQRYGPTAEESRSSEDSVELLSVEGDVDDARQLRRELEQMEVLEGDVYPEGQPWSRHTMLPGLSKRIAVIKESLSAFRFPSVPIRLSPSFLLYIKEHLKPGWTVLARALILFAVLVLLYGVVVLRVASWKAATPGQEYVPESVRSFVQGSVDSENIRRNLYEVTYDDHVAGTKGDFFLAEWVYDRFVAAGLDNIQYDDYEVYLNYPRDDGRRVAIVSPPELAWQAILEEEILPEKKEQHQVPVFHGLSKSGNVTGPLIYANYGAKEDFVFLRDHGIDVKGSIVIVRYGGTQTDRAFKVKDAELAGAIGCLIYSDPKEDGFLKGKPWPDGPYRTSDSVQRGSVALTSFVVGDVLTPGSGSLPNAERISPEDAAGLVKIPSLPLAWRDAQVLLQSIANTGILVPESWIGGVPEVKEWRTGNLDSSPVVNLMNLQDENIKQPIRNVIGRIEGVEDPKKMIYVGNHRDAWCFGSVDAGAGTAVMIEIVRVFGELLSHGWRPRRTIVFASWDAEEYNIIGSTEHVESSIDSFRADGVAYINVDVGVAGHKFRAAGSPLFENLLLHILHRIEDPSDRERSLLDAWNVSSSKLEGLGAGSDYIAFQDLAGCASLDIGFEGPEEYPYHSCLETFEWMEKIVDPDFEYHAALAQVWGLLILELADEPLLPFDFTAYTREVSRYVDDLKAEATAISQSLTPGTLDFHSLDEAAQLFLQTVPEFLGFEEKWAMDVSMHGMVETAELFALRINHNARATYFDTNLLDLPPPSEGRRGGVPGREQYKHVIFGPQKWSGYKDEVFPAIRDALGDGDWEGAQKQLEIVAKTLRHAAWRLVHN